MNPQTPERTATVEQLLRQTAVLIPALNEEDALPAVLAALPMERLHSVVVADNGSIDRTASIARTAGAIVVREPRRGYGAACLAGIAQLAAAPAPPRAVAFLDADHPECAAALPLLLAPLARGADLALGVRVAPDGSRGNLRAHARWGNRLVLATAPAALRAPLPGPPALPRHPLPRAATPQDGRPRLGLDAADAASRRPPRPPDHRD